MEGRGATTNSSNGLRPLLICPHQDLFQNLSRVWGEAEQAEPMLSSREYIAGPVLRELVAGQTPNICFLDMASNREAALALIRQVRELGIPVVALHTSNEPELILSCLRHGSAEFLYLPLTLAQFVPALDRITRRNHTAARTGGEVFCVVRGKSGCGSTTVASNIAFQLRALNFTKVLLADLDPLTGTVAFLLKLTSNYSFVHALANSSRLDEALWKGMVTSSRGVDVLLSPDMPADLVYEPDDLAAMVKYWRQLYEFVILDIPGPQYDWGLALARLADELLLITTNELPAVHATQNTLACLNHNGISRSKVKLVINRYNQEIGLGSEAVESALELKIFHQLPSDYEGVQKALMEGKPVPAGIKLGKSFTDLAEKLSGRKQARKKQSLLGGLFSVFEMY